MKKVLITGAGGFIGSHLTELCLEKGFEVRAFVHYNSRNSWGWLENSPAKGDVEIFSGDVSDFQNVKNAMYGMDAVFHLAALIGIPYSYEAPWSYIQTNIVGTYNILENARELNLANVVITSTSETYGTAQYVPIDEKHPLVGQSPYSASKIAADQLAVSYFRSFQLPVRIVRPINVYGPRQSARAIIPTVISQLLSGEKTIRIGNPEPSRDLTFVWDTVKGFLAVAESEKTVGEVVNLGTQEEITIGDLARLIAETAGLDIELISEGERLRPDKSEVQRLLCDSTRVLELTGWRPEYSLNKGLKETLSWFEKHLSLYKYDVYNR
ncbi:MAG: NAD-dependent epimerase/dehydratase family protein [Candidatus Aminicenantes bacterium]|nr:NAD-dependent epimerase/dehydratase family protein [Candidatus Aminicenantes bacterium]